jgi:hypothetical protein
MEIPEILERLRYNHGHFEKAAVLAAIERREEITPKLLEIVEDARVRAEELAKDDDYFAHFYALFLLGQFRERQAYRPIFELFSVRPEVLERLTEGFITDGLAPVLASVAHGDTSLVKRLIEDPQVSEWARASAANSLGAMVGAGELARDEAVAYLRARLRQELDQSESQASDYFLWTTFVTLGMHLYPSELMPEIKAAFRAGLVEEGFVCREDVQAALDEGKEAVLAQLSSRHPLAVDTVGALAGWACFDEDRKKEEADWKAKNPPKSTGLLDLPHVEPLPKKAHWQPEEEASPPSPVPLSRSAPKVGRNDPCPCGSGKKYKKCCEGKAN